MYGFVIIMVSFESLIICLSIDTSFVMIALQKRARGYKIGFNVKK